MIQLLAMLFPSPTQAMTLPSQPPSVSRTVSRSASTWQGCSRSVRPLITGIGAIASQLLDIGVIVGADHDPVEIAGEDPCGVPDRLAPAQLDVAGGEEERVPAELEGADLEGDPGAGGALGEDHPQGLPGERLLPVLASLHPGGQIE